MPKTMIPALALALAALGPAAAQQPPPAQQQQAQPNPLQDPTFLQRALGAMQTQRNAALDAQALAEARLNMLAEELARTNSELAKARQPASPPPPPPAKE